MAVLQVPSEVTDRLVLCVPDKNVVESDDEWKRYGKWSMIKNEPDLDFVDKAWVALQPLVADGTLVMLKASTALDKEESSAVICFTRPGKEEARRSAEAIRRAVDFPALMHYKLNHQTDIGLDRRYGHRCFAIYSHSYLGRFYVKDSDGCWMMDSQDAQENISAASPSYLQLLSSISHLSCSESRELPSKSNKRNWNIGFGGIYNFHLFCSLKKEDEHLLPEVDRVWVVLSQLYRDGDVTSISWRKNENIAKVLFYIDRKASVSTWLEHCDMIYAKALTRKFIYIFWGSSQEGTYTHVYTPEGELYYHNKFVMERRRPQTSGSATQNSVPETM